MKPSFHVRHLNGPFEDPGFNTEGEGYTYSDVLNVTKLTCEAKVCRFEALHFSPKYMNITDRLIEEAEREFRNYN
jgi:hypothetical protein